MPNVIVIDAGQDIVGVYSVTDAKYTPYRGGAMLEALRRIQNADELVTYNGNRYDLRRLAEIAAQATAEFSFTGRHSDMQDIYWGNIVGSSLINTYSCCFGSLPTFPETYEGSNECDVYMTFKLWEAWQRGELVNIHGRVIPRNAT